MGITATIITSISTVSIYKYPIMGEGGYLKRKAQTINNL